MSRKINDAISARPNTSPRPQRIIGGKNQRVSRAINRRGRRSRAIDLRQNDARGPCSGRKAGTGVPGVGQVNQKIARHTQNSTAQWNLNSAKAVELNSLRSSPSSLALVISLPPSPSPLLRRLASYSFSFVIRKQTERRSCQVGGVGDETAVSVRPSFFRLRHSTLPRSLGPPPSPFPLLPARSVPSYTGSLSQTSHHIFRCVDGPPDSPLRLGTIMWKEQAAKGGRYNSLPNAGRHYRALFRLPFLSSVLFTMRRNTLLEMKDGERAKKKGKIGKLDTRDGE